MRTARHYDRLATFIAGALTFVIAAIVSPDLASAQTRIISLSGDLDFGRIPVGSSAQRTLTISNSGDSVLTISNLVYPPTPVFVSVDIQGNWSGPIAPGESQDVVITFTPLRLSLGGTNDLDFQGYLSVESDATGGTNYIAMSAVGTWPPASRILSLTSNLNFGSVPIGTINGLSLALTNQGNSPLTISNITLPDGFRAVPGGGFDSFFIPGTIAPGAWTNIVVQFNPTNVAAYGGIATITSDSTEVFPANSLGVNQFAVSGTGVYPSGKFIGLFMPTNNPTFDSSGYFIANCSTNGKFRATITLGGNHYPFSGRVSPSGFVSGTIARRKLPGLNVSLQHGGMFGREWTGTIDDGTWTADLLVEPAPLLPPGTIRSISPGQYMITIAGSTNATDAPTNQGTGAIEIKISDVAHVKGILGDGTRYSQNTIVCGYRIPFYAPLYGHRGAILGWINLELLPILPPPPIPGPIPLAASDRQFFGTLHWFKPAGIDPDYPNGFSFQTTATGPIP